MNFDSRETYLAAVKEWKAEYAALSTKIREIKASFKAAQRSEVWTDISRTRNLKEELRDQAAEMLSERAAGKIEAQRQYQERLNSWQAIGHKSLSS